MAQNEFLGCPTCGRGRRDGERAYSAFHRVKSAMRWISEEDAMALATINTDQSFWIECHNKSFEPVAIFETACDFDQKKNATAIRNLASGFTRHELRAYTVFYRLGNDIDPVTNEIEIISLRVRREWPPVIDVPAQIIMTPSEWFLWLVKLRRFGVQQIITAASVEGK